VKKRATIKDVAKKAGVSHPTVSRVIHNSPTISDKTKRRVRKAMESLGYQPDLVARTLVRSKSRVLAAIIPDLNPHVQPILRGIADACRRSNYGLMLFSTEYWTEEELSYMWIVDNWRVDGVLIYNVVYHDEVTQEIRNWRFQKAPFVFINKYLRQKEVNTVSVDNFDAVLQAVTHLVNLGHERIGILNGSLMSVDGIERFLAFKEALTAHGLSFHEELTGYADFSDEQAYEEMTRILYGPSLPTAMFCANDMMAIGVVRAIKEKGLRVPEDIAVVGFDDIDVSRYFSPPLSTFRAPLREAGEIAVSLLMKIIENPKRPPEQIPLKAKLVIRESSGSK